MTLTVEKLLAAAALLKPFRAPPAFRIVETTTLPMRHVADHVVAIHYHPVAAWFMRHVLRRRAHPCVYFLPGKAVMAPGDMFTDERAGVIYCHPAQAAELRRQFGARL